MPRKPAKSPKRPSSAKPAALREPVQVYLAGDDRDLLNRVALAAGVSRAEVLRRGLRRIGAEVLAHDNAMSRFLSEVRELPTPPGTPDDLGARHDDYLAGASLDRHEPPK